MKKIKSPASAKGTRRAGKKLDNFGEKKAPQYKPGESGNPSGGKPGTKYGLRARYRAILKKQGPENFVKNLRKAGIPLDEGDVAEVIAGVIATKAMEGDIQAAKEIAMQTEEPLRQHHELTGGDGGPIRLESERVTTLIGSLLRLAEQRDADKT